MKDKIETIRLSVEEAKLYFDQRHDHNTIYFNKVGDEYAPASIYIETNKLPDDTAEGKAIITCLDVYPYSIIVFKKQFPLNSLPVLRGKTIGLVFIRKEWVTEDNKFPIHKTSQSISIFKVENDLSLTFINSEQYKVTPF
jgi:hypothetical protein